MKLRTCQQFGDQILVRTKNNTVTARVLTVFQDSIDWCADLAAQLWKGGFVNNMLNYRAFLGSEAEDAAGFVYHEESVVCS